MNVKFITTKKSTLSTVPIVDGQLIFCADKNASYYDMNSVRRSISGNNVITELPLKGSDGEIYVVTGEENPGIYVWDETLKEFVLAADISPEDRFLKFFENVDENKLYITGLNETADKDNDDRLDYNKNIYIVPKENKIHAEVFEGKADEAKNADNATEAKHATSADNSTSADSADKLSVDDTGSPEKPVYFKDGIPAECDHTLKSDVPEDAVFTDTTYDAFKGATSEDNGEVGLVPEPSTLDTEKFLKGDGTWSDVVIPDMVGCVPEESKDGEHGLVPQPTQNDFNRFLKGDGTWAEYSAGSGIVKTSLTFGLEETGVIPGTYGQQPDEPDGDTYTGNELRIPQITVDKYGRVIAIKEIICIVQGGPVTPKFSLVDLTVNDDGDLTASYEDDGTAFAEFSLDSNGVLSAEYEDTFDVNIASTGQVTVEYEE